MSGDVYTRWHDISYDDNRKYLWFHKVIPRVDIVKRISIPPKQFNISGGGQGVHKDPQAQLFSCWWLHDHLFSVQIIIIIIIIGTGFK